jgi:hypothetical protein
MISFLIFISFVFFGLPFLVVLCACIAGSRADQAEQPVSDGPAAGTCFQVRQPEFANQSPPMSRSAH